LVMQPSNGDFLEHRPGHAVIGLQCELPELGKDPALIHSSRPALVVLADSRSRQSSRTSSRTRRSSPGTGRGARRRIADIQEGGGW
jgi:hypothetical protein